MFPFHRSRPAVALAGFALLAAPATARDVRAGALRLSGAWTRPTPPGAPAGAGYLTVTNAGTRPDRLIGGSSPAVDRIELHEMTMRAGVMRMRPLANGLALEPGRLVELAPGGYHLMLIGPKRSLTAGATVPVTLRFERAGAVRVRFDVRATPPASGGSGDGR